MEAAPPYPMENSSAVPEAGLFGWLRYYGALIVLLCVVGASCFAYAAKQVNRGSEAWTLVVDTRRELPTRQVGVVAKTLFNTRVADTGLADLQLRAVPDARLLFVVATHDDRGAAVSASRAAADLMIGAFEEVGYPGFEIVGTKEPGPIPQRSTSAVFAGFGAAFGLGVGVATTLISYSRRRPVLTVERAQELLRPTSTDVVRGRWRWTGALRAQPPVPSNAAQRSLQERQLPGPVVFPGAARHRAASIQRRLQITPAEDDASAAVVVCAAGTPERELRPLREAHLVWIS